MKSFDTPHFAFVAKRLLVAVLLIGTPTLAQSAGKHAKTPAARTAPAKAASTKAAPAKEEAAAADPLKIPASEDHIRELLQLNRVPQLIAQVRDTTEAKTLAQAQKDTAANADPRAKEKIAVFSKLLNETLAWEQVEPVAIGAYKAAKLKDFDAVDLINYYKSPNGQLWSSKMAPLLDTLRADILKYMEAQAAEAYVHMKNGTPPAIKPAAKPYSEKEMRALALLNEMGKKTVSSYFEVKVTYMENLVAPIVVRDKDAPTPIGDTVRKLADIMRHSCTYQDIEPIAVRALATLSDEDIATLTEDSKPLERKFQFAQLETLERTLAAHINAMMEKRFSPALRKALIEIDAPPPAPAASTPAASEAEKPASK